MSTKMTWEEACQILGVPLAATMAEINTRHIHWNQLLHPDKTSTLPQSVRVKAEDDLKKINSAYDFLKNSRNRPNYGPPKLHVTVSHVRFNVENGEKKSTTFKVSNTGGPYTSFWMDDAPAPWLKVLEVKSLSDTPLPIEVTIEATGTSVPKGHTECFLPVKIENEPTHAVDEVKLKVEMNLKSASPDVSSAGTSSPSHAKPSRLPKLGKWEMSLICIVGLTLLGLGIGVLAGNNISFWVLSGFSCIFVLEKWLISKITKIKIVYGLYKLLLNISLLSLLGLLIWSGIQLFSHQFFKTPLIGSLVFVGELVFFVIIWKFTAKHGAQWPSMKLTIFSLIALFFIFAFAGVQPMTDYKNSILGIFSEEDVYVPSSSMQSQTVTTILTTDLTSTLFTNDGISDTSAKDWSSSSSDQKTTSIQDDYNVFRVGKASLRLQTESGYDVSLSYHLPNGIYWDLNNCASIHFWLMTENTNIGFQNSSPWIKLLSSDTDYFQYQANTDVLNNSINQWQEYYVPLRGDNIWICSINGSVSLTKISGIEIHADTWEYGFKLWLDGLGF
jgi:hypothetical protein